MNLVEAGYACLGFILSKGREKTKEKTQIICIRTTISNITNISKPSVAFNLKELRVLCRQYTNNTSSLQCTITLHKVIRIREFWAQL